jgi:hypothetical protein
MLNIYLEDIGLKGRQIISFPGVPAYISPVLAEPHLVYSEV